MQYIPQQHEMGCGIAAVAMVLDMSYEQASQFMRPPDREDWEALLLTGLQFFGLERLRRHDCTSSIARKESD